MRFVLVYLLLFCCATPLAAENFDRTAQSGRKVLIREYANFNLADCSPYPGSVKVITKPMNGTLATGTGPYVISTNRFTGTQSKCAGTRTTALRVYYTSRPGFRGTDTFVVNATYRAGLLSVTDRYTVNVR